MRDDLRFALRSLRRQPLVTIVAALTLAVGIGGATAVFSVVDAVVLRALPYPQSDRLVRIWETTREGDRFSFADATFLDLQEESQALVHVAAWREMPPRVMSFDRGDPQRLVVVPVSRSIVDVLGVPPQLGRMFTADEDGRRRAARVVLSDAIWRTHFGASAQAIGRTLVIDDAPHEIVGVMPAGFDFPGGAQAWVPLGADAAADAGDKSLEVAGRMRDGVTHAQLAEELRAFGRRWAAMHAESNAGWSAEAIGFSEWIVSPRFRDAVWVLFAAVALLLVLACANVANLLIAQAASRRGEMRVRAALGAGRRRLVRQLLTESALLAALGTVAGVLVAIWSVDAVRVLGVSQLPRIDGLRVDGGVLLFACAAGVLSCLGFGLVPAIHAARVDLRAALGEGVRYTARGRGLRHSLVVAEVALAVLLLVGAGLVANSFWRLTSVDPGFDVDQLVAMPIARPPARYGDERAAEFYADVLERLRTVPGIVSAAATTTDPLREFGFSNNVTPEERAAEAPPSGLVQAGWRSVTPEFFTAMGIPVIAGRGFDSSDRAGGDRVVIVSAGLAGRLWPDESPIGKRIFWGGTTGRTRTVVGVAGDVRDVQLEAAPPPILYLPHAQVDVPAMTVVMRTSEPLDRLVPVLRQRLGELDASLMMPPVHRVQDSRAAATAAPRFNVSLLAAFAGIALVLAVTGVYAMLAFTVSERRREMAVRLALGASGSRVARLVLQNGVALALTGILVGSALALAATRLLTSLLFGVGATDPLTFAAAALGVLVTATIASYLPARTAGRIDAIAMLRE